MDRETENDKEKPLEGFKVLTRKRTPFVKWLEQQGAEIEGVEDE